MKNSVDSKPNKSALKKKILIGSLAISLFSLSFVEDLFQVSKNLDIFASVYKNLSINYVDNVNSSEMMKTGMTLLDDIEEMSRQGRKGK